MKFRLAAVAALALAGTPARAELVPRAEYGQIEFALGAPIGLDAPREVGVGDLAWSETISPTWAVRLLADSASRTRPGAPGRTAGEILFGYRLSTGMAFCPLLDLDRGVPRVQCLRDFDGDGAFDGSYVTSSRGSDSRVALGQLHGLNPMPRVRYEQVSPEFGPEIPAAVSFAGWQRGKARFRVSIEGERMENSQICEPTNDELCLVMGLLLRTRRNGEKLWFQAQDAAGPRTFTMVFTKY